MIYILLGLFGESKDSKVSSNKFKGDNLEKLQ